MRALTQYGQELIAAHAREASQELSRRGVIERASLTQFSIALQGFYEGLVWDYDLYYSGNLSGAQQQVEAAALFIKNFHLDLMGSAYPPFQRVVIEPVTNFDVAGSRIIQRGFELTLYMPGGDYAYSANTLRDYWNQCHHLGALCSSTAAKQKWAMLNPVGTIQTQLRQGIRRMIETVMAEMDWFGKQSSQWNLEQAKSEFRSVVERMTNRNYRTSRNESLVEAMDRKVADCDTVAKLVDLMDRWKRELGREGIQEETSRHYAASWVLGKKHYVRRAQNVWALVYFEWTDDIIVSVGHDTITYDPAEQTAGGRPAASTSPGDTDYIRALLAIRLQESETIDIGTVNLSVARLFGVQSIALDRVLR